MPKLPLFLSALFVLAHVALFATTLPLATAVPTALGAMSVTAMGLTLVLAARWRVVDHIMGGPDKSYVAHRWLGFLALAGALLHWGTAADLRPAALPMLADGAEGLGTVAVNGLLVMTAAAMIRAIPYHLWKASHMLMGPVFALAAAHTLILASPAAIGTVPWTVMAAVSAIGLLGWAQTLLRKLSPTRLVTVEKAEPFEGGVDVTLWSATKLPAFRPGQYATLAGNHARAEAHPFTVAGGDATSRRFVIRAAGDWTSDFVSTVKVGDQFRVSGGVGRFLPKVNASRKPQIWVAGGVGITPFMAALEQMQPDAGASVTLVLCIKSRASAGGLADVERHAARLPQVNLVVFNDEDGRRMTKGHFAQLLQAAAPKTEMYLCGPEGLKTLVSTCWAEAGMTGKIHSERFDFRGAYGMSDLVYVGRPILGAAQSLIKKARTLSHAPAGT